VLITHPLTLISNLVSIYNLQGWYGEVEELYTWVIAMKEKALGADHTSTHIN
jgi:hypothetical protein